MTKRDISEVYRIIRERSDAELERLEEAIASYMEDDE